MNSRAYMKRKHFTQGNQLMVVVAYGDGGCSPLYLFIRENDIDIMSNFLVSRMNMFSFQLFTFQGHACSMKYFHKWKPSAYYYLNSLISLLSNLQEYVIDMLHTLCGY